MTTLAQAEDLPSLLELRGDQLAVCRETPWLAGFAEVPDDAAAPLAMSGPHPRAVGSYGAECIAWARESMDIAPRWWQALAITRQLEHDADGALVWREVVESGPRRIGKSVRLRVSALWRLAHADRFLEQQLAMLVSKDLAVGKEIHRGAWRWAEKKDWNVTRLNGAQEIESPSGARWLLRAPNACYGYDVGYGQVDESWGVDPMAITDGLEPALLERHSAQLHLTSTAHVKASSLMRRRLLTALRALDPDVLLLLWGAHPNADVSAEPTWRAASPHWSRDRRDLIARKYAAALAGQDEPEFDDPDPIRGWAAQYLNVWPLLMAGSSSALPLWGRLASSVPAEPVPLALGVASDREQTWISLGGSIAGDRPHLALIDRRRAADRAAFAENVADVQRRRQCPVAIRAKNFLIPDLERAGVELTVMSRDEAAQSAADLATAVENGEVEHGDYPELNQAVSIAQWWTFDGGRLFDTRRGDISALEGVAIAHWVANNEPAYDVLDSIF